jgi:hypothetical protein
MDELNLKLVVSSFVWTNVGSSDLPLWKTVGAKEYIVKYFTGEPTFEMINEELDKVSHMFEGGDSFVRETVAGFEIYFAEAPTNSETFQANLNGAIDFPPIDLTAVDVTEELSAILA